MDNLIDFEAAATARDQRVRATIPTVSDSAAGRHRRHALDPFDIEELALLVGEAG